MKSLGKRRTRKTRRQKTRKVGGVYGRNVERFKDIAKVLLDKLSKEMVVILRPETYEAFETKTNEFKALNEKLYQKASSGPLSREDIRNYEAQYIAWRDLLDHPVYIRDVARLREVGAFDEHRKPKSFIYTLNKIIAKFVAEMIDPDDHDPYIEQEYREEMARIRREREDRQAQLRIQARVESEHQSRIQREDELERQRQAELNRQTTNVTWPSPPRSRSRSRSRRRHSREPV